MAIHTQIHHNVSGFFLSVD